MKKKVYPSGVMLPSLWAKSVIGFLALVLVACSSTQGPVVIRESSAPIASDKADSSSDTTVISVQPVSPDSPKTRIPLVEKLVAQSNAEVSRKNYDKAINLAERGLRIDRKDPRLYLVLSKAYRGELNHQQSVYFAKQGLRYAEKEGETYQALVSLAEAVK